MSSGKDADKKVDPVVVAEKAAENVKEEEKLDLVRNHK